MDEELVHKLNSLILKFYPGHAGRTSFCSDVGVSLERFSNWLSRGFPSTEWTGKTQYARKIEQALHGEIKAIEICPLAGQYMQQSEKKAA